LTSFRFGPDSRERPTQVPKKRPGGGWSDDADYPLRLNAATPEHIAKVYYSRRRVKDLFVHHSAIVGGGYRSLAEGAKVSYETEAGERGPRA
jgi:hypothetical protein